MIGVYIHVPFCAVRCSYCDFYLVTARGRDMDAFTTALRAEIGAIQPPLRGTAVDTVHFGGGTPSILRPAHLAGVLETLRGTFRVTPDAEITLEANPDDIEAYLLRDLAALGVNRLSLGVQALDDRLLALLRRTHTSRRALAAVDTARQSPIRSVAADLMLGLPGQREREALEALSRLTDRGVDHLSLYLLEVHARTRLGRQVALGRLTPAADDDAAALYERAVRRLTERGFEHYEISNFARHGHRSRHNLKYWTDQEFLGFGPAAHSYVSGRRWSNAPDLAGYVGCGGIDVRRIEDPQPRAGRGAEALFSGLRLTEGVDLKALRRRYGASMPGVDDPRLEPLRRAGLVELTGTRLVLTGRGRLLSNEVFQRFLPTP